MTNSQKLDLLLEKVDTIENKVTIVESDIQELKVQQSEMIVDIQKFKRQHVKSVAELKSMDRMIFEEVERVHHILEKHIVDVSKHLA